MLASVEDEIFNPTNFLCREGLIRHKVKIFFDIVACVTNILDIIEEERRGTTTKIQTL